MHFTIHGLWPNYNNGQWPQFCDPDYKFDEDQIADLEVLIARAGRQAGSRLRQLMKGKAAGGALGWVVCCGNAGRGWVWAW